MWVWFGLDWSCLNTAGLPASMLFVDGLMTQDSRFRNIPELQVLQSVAKVFEYITVVIISN